MLTRNAYAHPLMSHMHKPDPKLASDKQTSRQAQRHPDCPKINGCTATSCQRTY